MTSALVSGALRIFNYTEFTQGSLYTFFESHGIKMHQKHEIQKCNTDKTICSVS